jgi:4-aminobutyrate aminotransferase-like enzyme
MASLKGIPVETHVHPIYTDMATNRAAVESQVDLRSAKNGSRDSSNYASSNYKEYVNPQWVALLTLLGMNVEYERCLGCELFAKDGRRVLDFLSGYCVHNTGHNHPYIIQALKNEMDKCGPAMLQSHVPRIAGVLERRLC